MHSDQITSDELAQLEHQVLAALRDGDESALNVLGYGELSVALGWPADAPAWVCKRTPPFNADEFTAYAQLVNDYVERVRAAGLKVADTTVMHVERDGQLVGYLVQPLLDKATLGHQVLAASEPDPDHPFLTALADVLTKVTPSVSVDAQVTNFAWNDSTLTLIDVGTPFLWDGDDLLFDMKPFLRMLPAPTRPLVKREMTKLIDRWREPRRVALDIVANLYREGMPTWVDPTVEALNRRLDPNNPITADEARGFYEEDLKTWPLLKRLQRVERWWQTSARRGTYDWFIHSTF